MAFFSRKPKAEAEPEPDAVVDIPGFDFSTPPADDDAPPVDEVAPPQEELTDEQLHAQVRVRLMPDAALVNSGMTYGRAFAPGLTAVMCVDYPSHVSFLSDAALDGLDIFELFNSGYRNVMAEPVDAVQEVAPGILLLSADSPFMASKAIGMGALIGDLLPEAPNGVLFGVPHRHVIVAHVVVGADTVRAVGALAGVVAGQATDEAPGGPLSSSIYYWHEGVADVAASVGEGGGIQVDGSGRFGTNLQALLG